MNLSFFSFYYLSESKENVFVNMSLKLSLYSTEAFSAERGARDGATKVMLVVTDGESHDGDELHDALVECENRNITRYAIAVSALCTFTLNAS